MYLSDVFTISPNIRPARLSIPCGLSEALPVGLQLIGPQFSEDTFIHGHVLEPGISNR